MTSNHELDNALQIQILTNLFLLQIKYHEKQLKVNLFDIQTKIMYEGQYVKNQCKLQDTKIINELILEAFKEVKQVLLNYQQQNDSQSQNKCIYYYGTDLQSESFSINIQKQCILIKNKKQNKQIQQIFIDLYKNKNLNLKSILDIYIENQRMKLKKQIYSKNVTKIQNQKLQLNLPFQLQQNSAIEKFVNQRDVPAIQKNGAISQNAQKLLQQNIQLKKQLQQLKIKIGERQNQIFQLNNNESELKLTIRKYREILPQEIINWIEPQRFRSSSTFSAIISNNKQIQNNDETTEQNQISNSLIKPDHMMFKKKLKEFMLSYQANKQCFSKITDKEDIGNYRESNQSQVQLPTNSKMLTNMVCKENPYYQQFKIDGNQASYIGSGLTKIFGGWCQLMVNQQIPRDAIYRFYIKIVKSDRRAIIIGIVDKKKQGKNKTPNEENTIGYYGRWGKLIPTGTEQGTGFFEGQTVQVKVKMSSKMIKWSVGTEVRAKLYHPNLGDPNRIFVPYIQMRHSSDIIEWCGSTVQGSKVISSSVIGSKINH